MLVQVWVGQTGPSGWGVIESLDAASDGSWSGDVTFGFQGPTGPASMGASCDDSFDAGSNPYVDYQTRSVQLVAAPPSSTTTTTTTTASTSTH